MILYPGSGRGIFLLLILSFFLAFCSPIFAEKIVDMNKTIRRRTVLQEMDVKTTPDAKQVVFSIQFDKKNGERVYFPRAVSCGLKMNLKENRTRGIIPVDGQGNRIGHPTPVGIDRIIRFNGMEVQL